MGNDGCREEVYVHCGMTPDLLRVEVEDEGEGFDPTQVPDPTDPEQIENPTVEESC